MNFQQRDLPDDVIDLEVLRREREQEEPETATIHEFRKVDGADGTLGADLSSGELVMGRVYGFIGRFVSYPSTHARVAHALWIMHTHRMDVWDSTPRIAFLNETSGTGRAGGTIPFPDPQQGRHSDP
jgi:hypothetical protein